jgi:hypothetical protein
VGGQAGVFGVVNSYTPVKLSPSTTIRLAEASS